MIVLFHERCPSLPNIKSLTEKRKKTMKTRWSDLKGDIIEFQSFLDKVEGSDFLTNRTGKWRADFDWIMAQHNFVKIIEGTYDVRNQNKKSKNGFHNHDERTIDADIDEILRQKGRAK